VGSSRPALTCDPSIFSGEWPDYLPASATAEQTLINRAKSYAADCEKRYGWLLPYMTSKDVARDMNSIRAALGVPAISYFGYSYGTYLGQVFATLFTGCTAWSGQHRGPTGAWYADNIAQVTRSRAGWGRSSRGWRRMGHLHPGRTRARSTRPGTGPGPGSNPPVKADRGGRLR
jgi:hypothetical protein